MRSRRLALSLVVQLMAAAACSTEPGSEPAGPRFIPTVGGQSGQEGACQVAATVDGFDLDATLESVLGRHETKLRWNDSDETPAADPRLGRERASFEISSRGKSEVDGECGPSSVLDIDVRMQVPGSELDVTFEAQAAATATGNLVVIAAKLDPEFRRGMTGRARKFVDDLLRSPGPDATDEYYYFDMWQFRDRVSGHLLGRHKGGGCALAVWPEAYCEDKRIAMPVDEALGDLEMSRVLEAVNDLGEQALEWSDGRSARVRFEVEPSSGLACVGAYFLRYGDDQGGTDIALPARIHAISDDGSLDVTLTGKVVATVLEKQGFTGRVRVEADTVVSATANAGRVPLVPPNAGGALRVELIAERGIKADEIFVYVLSVPGGAARTSSDMSERDDAARMFACSGAAPETGSIETLLQGTYSKER